MSKPRQPRSALLLLLCLAVAALASACGTSGGSSGDAAAPGADARVDASKKKHEAGADAPLGLGGDSTKPSGPLAIAPAATTIVVPYGTHAPKVTYKATSGGETVPASFAIDLGQIGTMDASTGVLTPSGTIGGVANVTATYGGKSVSTTVTVTLHQVQNGAPGPGDGGVVTDAATDASTSAGGIGGVGGSGPGGPVTATVQKLLEGTPVTDKGLAWLYPYDKTVWPQGLLAPLLQWQPGATGGYDAVYIHLQETGFDYQGFFSAPATPFVNHPILQKAWDTLSYSNQGSPVTVTLVFASGGKAYGPITETWSIAQGTLTGTVYYNSYGTALAINYHNTTDDTSDAGYPNFGGATLAIKHGATGPVLVAGSSVPGAAPFGAPTTNSSASLPYCRVCHSVAAGGSVVVTQHGDDYEQTSAYSLTSGNAETVMPPLPSGSATESTFAFPALSPDGTFLFSNVGALPGTVYPAGSTSGLFSVPAGTAIPSTGLPDGGLAAATPSFSPDGTHLAFNDYGKDQASLAAIDFDQKKAAFSNLAVLYTPDAGTTAVFPAFLPTNDAVIFERELSGSFGATSGVRAELWWVDLKSKTAAPLSTLNGVGYLPVGPNNHGQGAPDGASLDDDTTLQYEPTVNPVASGGYAWVVFTTRRLYGNVATQDPFLSDPRNYNATLSATTKKLWVAAIDLNAKPGTDPSHPAFYLPGQELLACNSRGYWVVDPCEPNGDACLTGDQCCSGYCEAVDGGFVCGTQPKGCSAQGNKCAQTSDCCGTTSGVQCIDGYCALSAPR